MRLGIMPDILSQHIFQGIINKGIPIYRFCVRLESDWRKLMTNIDFIVAGAGIWGCKVARQLAEAGCKVLALEKRLVIDGNVRCEIEVI